MKWRFFRPGFFLTLSMVALVWGCRDVQSSAGSHPVAERAISSDSTDLVHHRPVIYQIGEDVTLKNYLTYIADLVEHLEDSLGLPLDEYSLVHHNPWIMDSLVATDYYHLKQRGKSVTDPLSLAILRKGDTLFVPSQSELMSIRNQLSNIQLDLNIPEFKLRILENGKVSHTFPVRVGKVEKKYLAMAGREVDLRTRTGEGEIVRINRTPDFINPVDNRRYRMTRRDDGVMTTLPNVPWIEPELDGQRHGQLIHPTTNIATLGKAYSNGCVGLREGDMWLLYYHAPLGTRVVFRYELGSDLAQNDTEIRDIYPGTTGHQRTPAERIIRESASSYCDCRALE